MKTFLFNTIILISFIGILYSNPDNEDPEATKAYQKGYEFILDEQWSEAVKAFNDVIKKHNKSGLVDDSKFWKCYAKEKLGDDLEDSFECYSRFIKENSESKWVTEAKTNMIQLSKKLSELGLKEYETRIRAMEEDSDREIVMSALSALQHMGDERATESLIEIYDGKNDKEIKEKILFALADLENPRAKEKLIDIARNDKEPELRKKAVFWLGEEARDKATLDLLRKIVDSDPDQSVRENAIFAISEAEIQYSTQLLAELAQKHRNETIRSKAVFWLGESSNDTEVGEILVIIAEKDPSQKVQEQAVFALSEWNNDRNIDLLKKIAESHKNIEVRKRALFWLGDKADSPEIISYLKQKALEDESDDMREYALFAISRAPDHISRDILKEFIKQEKNADLRKKALHFLSDSDNSPETISIIKNIIENDPYPEMQEYGAFLLSELDDDAGLSILIDVAKDHPKHNVRKKAIFWLGQSDSPKAKDALLEIINKK